MEWFGIGIALIIAGWVYSDAKERGSSSPTLWAVGVFALLIVFLPLYFFMRPSKKQLSKVNLCPFCGKYYDNQPSFCPNCGADLKDVNSKEG